VENESPVRLLSFGHQEKGCCKFYAEEQDKEKAAHPMKNPDKHSMDSFF
jgi:hypothetical protein